MRLEPLGQTPRVLQCLQLDTLTLKSNVDLDLIQILFAEDLLHIKYYTRSFHTAFK